MTNQQILVKHFMITGKQGVPKGPEFPTLAESVMRINITMEEVGELAQALGIKFEYRISISNEPRSLLAVADALTDIDYVNKGNWVACGLDDEDFFDEVHRSNMTKFVKVNNGELVVTKNHLGKILKPATYEPPNLQPILDRQIELAKSNETI